MSVGGIAASKCPSPLSSGPISRASSMTRPATGWKRQWKASTSRRSARSAAATISRASPALAAKGFSQSTCLPASTAAIVHSACRLAGSAT